jgi:hypothetical protein
VPSIPPAGFSPASAFTLIGHAVETLPVPILADAIDPATRDYLSVEDSATIADGLVVTLLGTERDSGAAVQGFGQRFRELRHVTGETGLLAESMAREALAPATSAGIVELRSVTAAANELDGTQVDADIDYLDLLAPPGSPPLTRSFNR